MKERGSLLRPSSYIAVAPFEAKFHGIIFLFFFLSFFLYWEQLGTKKSRLVPGWTSSARLLPDIFLRHCRGITRRGPRRPPSLPIQERYDWSSWRLRGASQENSH